MQEQGGNWQSAMQYHEKALEPHGCQIEVALCLDGSISRLSAATYGV